MMIESISISSVHATIGTCPPLPPLRVAAVAAAAVAAWVWLAAELGTVDFSKSSGPPTDGVTVSRGVTCISAEDSISHSSLLSFSYPHQPTLTSNTSNQHSILITYISVMAN